MRDILKNKKNLIVMGVYKAVDWDGWNNRPTYLLENVHVFNKNGELMDKVDHMWFLTDQELYKVNKESIIKFTGESYKYNKMSHVVDYSVRPTSDILITKMFDRAIRVGQWFKRKASKKMLKNHK